jgi:hypothetical protein
VGFSIETFEGETGSGLSGEETEELCSAFQGGAVGVVAGLDVEIGIDDVGENLFGGMIGDSFEPRPDREAFAAPLTMKTLGDMSYADIGRQLSTLADAYDVKLPRELVLIGKQFLYVERYMKLLAPKWQMMSDPQFSGYFANFMVEVSREHQKDAVVEDTGV